MSTWRHRANGRERDGVPESSSTCRVRAASAATTSVCCASMARAVVPRQCDSSTTIAFHARAESAPCSTVAIRNEVTTTFGVAASWWRASHAPAITCTSSGVSSSGSQRSNSSAHMMRSEAGTMRSTGHGRSAPRHAIACRVLPRPISSPSSPRPSHERSCSTPLRWNGRSESRNRRGMRATCAATASAVLAAVSASVGSSRKKRNVDSGTGRTWSPTLPLPSCRKRSLCSSRRKVAVARALAAAAAQSARGALLHAAVVTWDKAARRNACPSAVPSLDHTRSVSGVSTSNRTFVRAARRSTFSLSRPRCTVWRHSGKEAQPRNGP